MATTKTIFWGEVGGNRVEFYRKCNNLGVVGKWGLLWEKLEQNKNFVQVVYFV